MNKPIELDEPHSKALDDVMADDRQFFADHPERTLRIRRPYPVEHSEFDLTPGDLPAGCEWYVMVGKIDAQQRVREAFWSAPLHRPDQFSEAVCSSMLRCLGWD